MRVLHAISRYGLLSEGFLEDNLRGAERAGHEAWLLANHRENAAIFPFPREARTRYWPAPRDRGGRLLLGPGAHARRRRRALAAPVAAVAPALVHAHFGWNALDLHPVTTALGLPLVVTFHGSDATNHPPLRRAQRLNPLWSREPHRYARLLAARPAVIAVSEFLADRLRDLGAVGEIAVIPCGVRLELFAHRGPIPREPSEPEVRLLFVGRLVRRKGIDVCLEAVARVRARHPGVRLTVVGGGPLAADARGHARRLGLDGAVTFAGALPRPATLEALRRSEVLVTSSRTMPDGEAEGSPVVTKEAQAIGLVVAATDCGGTRETLPPERRDEIVAEDDPAALAARLEALIADREHWPERIARGRAWIEEAFDADALGRRAAVVYEHAREVHGAHSPPPPLAAARPFG